MKGVTEVGEEDRDSTTRCVRKNFLLFCVYWYEIQGQGRLPCRIILSHPPQRQVNETLQKYKTRNEAPYQCTSSSLLPSHPPNQ